MILNSIARDLHQWIAASEQSGHAPLVQILTDSEKVIKNELKTIRGETTPSPEPLDLESNISTDTELDHIRSQCLAYVARFKDTLYDYELRHAVDEVEYTQFIHQFIKDQLFNNVPRFIPFGQLPKQLNKFLQLVDWEVVPIEIGETKVDARVHEIQGSEESGAKPGTVAKVVLPGLRRKTDNAVVQKPVVIRAE